MAIAVTSGPVIRLTLPYPPSVNALYAWTRNGRALKPAHVEFRVLVRLAVREAYGDVELLEGPVTVHADAYRPRRRGDLDNVLKALLDALNGVVWRDDEQVVGLSANRFDAPRDPRVEVWVRPAGA